MNGSFLHVLEAGPFISVQDEGRPGYLRAGITPGGAIDPLALAQGAALTGNEKGLAALEILAVGGRFQLRGEPICAVLTGASIDMELEGKTVRHGTSFRFEPGQVIVLGSVKNGNYAYLSVSGGIDVTPVLGSRSTHIAGGFGGYKGRCLKRGDVVPIGETGMRDVWQAGLALSCERQNRSDRVRILWAAQGKLFGDDTLQEFAENSFTVSHELNRMGAKLVSNATPICAREGLTARSGAIAPGDIQVPGNGRPIVLLADHQPTGGYPRIATIIGADIARFAQLPAGSKVQFTPVSEAQALTALRQGQEQMDRQADDLLDRENDPFASHRLLSQNLISGVVSSAAKNKRGNKT